LPGIVDRNPSNAELNFDYRFAGSGKTTLPLKVYDDGSETHFQVANENKLVPIISSVDSFGLETKMSYTIRDRYVVIPGTATQFSLRNGNEITCIFNNKSMPVSIN
jgi:type IV secretion system protein VirB9